MKLPLRHRKLGSYLTVALDAGAAATSAEAGFSVTTYRVGGAPPLGIGSVSIGGDTYMRVLMGSLYSHQDVVFNMGRFMNAGAGCAADANGGFFAKQGAAIYHGTIGPVGFWRGAESGDDNYMRFGSSAMSGMDTIARFHFDGLGGGYMMGSAVDSNGNITFAAGSTAILNASLAATPEPAGFLLGGVSALIGTGALRRRGRPDSTLGLMALGAGGIRARRESAAAA